MQSPRNDWKGRIRTVMLFRPEGKLGHILSGFLEQSGKTGPIKTIPDSKKLDNLFDCTEFLSDFFESDFSVHSAGRVGRRGNRCNPLGRVHQQLSTVTAVPACKLVPGAFRSGTAIRRRDWEVPVLREELPRGLPESAEKRTTWQNHPG